MVLSVTKGVCECVYVCVCVCVCVCNKERELSGVCMRKDRHLVAKSDTLVLFPVSFLCVKPKWKQTLPLSSD